MADSAALEDEARLDLSDVEWRLGQLVGGGQLLDPCSSSDIRRWVMAMDYPNPIHWDEPFARASEFGGLVAPQSIAVCLDYGHGCQPAVVGHIAGSHLIFGGEEWWHYGYRIRPGDQLFQERRFHDYKIADTKFAGPTMFSRGDTIHRNQHGTVVAKARSTGIRYLAAEAEKRGLYQKKLPPKPKWTAEQYAEIDQVRLAWILSNREGISPIFGEVQVGQRLPRRVIGPHSIASFATEYRAFLFNTWGACRTVAPEGVKDPWVDQDPGWVAGFGFDKERAKIDPRAGDGLYVGPSRGHIDDEKAGEVGMARAYGYGATMQAWVTDYIAYWAGHQGFVRHVKSDFRGPAFEGDVTYFDGEIVEKTAETAWGVPLVTIKARLTNQNGGVLVDTTAEVELPLG
ncbi:MaoC family dehydratase N-terminal domain-containing protein [Phenylobacterium sp. LjRoot225]|uniref:FAS1-like dehydratase domain-containing protein n=1 Tax=Phenylobacterium sp. LjRoot225 TaxID=3342285 RepID=UPI003ED0BD7B